MRIGLDFDNTIAGYDHLFLAAGREQGLLPPDFAGAKKAVRDHIRTLPGSEAEWTRLQAEVYGRRMAEAALIEGVGDFLRLCRRRGIPVVIVSHKTRYAAADPGGVDLHAASRAWMAAQGFFAADGFGIPAERVFFEATREDKCRRIGGLDLSHFIDDLEEVFREPAFPAAVDRLLFHTGEEEATPGPFRIFSSWAAISDDLLGRA